MSKLGNELIKAVKEAQEKGLVTLQSSPDVAALRKDLGLSQTQFAKHYHINPETVKKWEQHKREPDAISRAYLKCIEKAPEVIKDLVNS